jgi:hypothetical protein
MEEWRASVSKLYERERKITYSDTLPVDVALGRVGWKKGGKVLVEFPDGLYENPVYEGVGRRVLNPNYPDAASQRYAWRGSPHDRRIPRLNEDGWTVKYMTKRYRLIAENRIYDEDTEGTIAFVAKES